MRMFLPSRAVISGILLAAAAAIGVAALTTPGPAIALASHPGQPYATVRTLTSPNYAVTISLPASWRPTPFLGPGRFGYDGPAGWMQLSAAIKPSDLRHACVGVATANVQHPYGLHPRVIYRSVGGRPGCLIIPSSDAPRWPQRAGGPAFQISSAIAEYKQPVRIGGTSYPLLVIDADPAHLTAIANSAQPHH